MIIPVNKIVKADAFEELSRFKDGSFNAIITDPPYDFTEEQILWLHEQFCRLSSNIIVFAPPENPWVYPANQYGFWIKPISTKNTSKSYSRFVECIYFYNITTWNAGRHWSQYTNVFTDLVDDTKVHPYRKPPSLIERLIRNHTNEGDLILDPFAGSGVILDVAQRLNRKCISLEITA